MTSDNSISRTVLRSIFVWLISSASVLAAEDREAAVRNDPGNVASAGGWIYNDLPAGFAEAAKTRKPMLVVFRCVP
jgi:serine protease Do